jgi:hypothetical protein
MNIDNRQKSIEQEFDYRSFMSCISNSLKKEEEILGIFFISIERSRV